MMWTTTKQTRQTLNLREYHGLQRNKEAAKIK